MRKVFLILILVFPLLLQASKKSILIKAQELLNRGEVDSALVLLRPLLSERKPSKEGGQAYFLAVSAYYRLGVIDSVLSLSGVFLNRYRKSVYRDNVLYLRGKALGELGEKEEALKLFLQAIKTKNGKLRESIRTSILQLFEGPEKEAASKLLEEGKLGKRLEKTKRVDILLPLSAFPSLSEEFLRGFRLAGPGDIEEKIWDVELKKSRAIQLVRKISGMSTSLVIVALPSEQADEVAPLLNLSLLPSLYPLSEDLSLVEADGMAYPFVRRYYDEIDRLLEYAARKGLEKLALFYPDVPLGNSVKNIIYRKLSGYGLEVVLAGRFRADTLAFRELKPILEERGCQAVIIPGITGNGMLLAAHLRYEGVDMPILGLEGWGDELASRWGGRFIENVVFVKPTAGLKGDVRRDTEKRDLMKSYQARYGGSPSTVAQMGYDAGNIVKALFSGGPLNPFQVKEALDSMAIYPGVSGYILLYPGKRFIKYYTYRNGRAVELKEE
ncbi:MAG: ABC transporter substrate-binding protein [Candidatus Hydrothermae bacterium]|nr:ABC transporter substrate-binding protein [Candidatus Hydrothermae bacterium]